MRMAKVSGYRGDNPGRRVIQRRSDHQRSDAERQIGRGPQGGTRRT